MTCWRDWLSTMSMQPIWDPSKGNSQHFYYGKTMTSNKDYSLFASSTASSRGLCVGFQNFSMYLSKTCYPVFNFWSFATLDCNFCFFNIFHFRLFLLMSCYFRLYCVRYDFIYWTKVLLRFIRKENLTDPPLLWNLLILFHNPVIIFI